MTSSQRFRPERKMVAARKASTLHRVSSNLQLLMLCRNAHVTDWLQLVLKAKLKGVSKVYYLCFEPL